MSMKSVSFSPAAFGVMRRSTAMRKEVTATPLGVYFNSGSVASRPIRITLFSICSPFHSSFTKPVVELLDAGCLPFGSHLKPAPPYPLGRDGSLHVGSDDEVAQDRVGNAQDAAEFGLRRRLSGEVHHHVNALSLAFHLVGQPPSLPFLRGFH